VGQQRIHLCYIIHIITFGQEYNHKPKYYGEYHLNYLSPFGGMSFKLDGRPGAFGLILQVYNLEETLLKPQQCY